MCNALRPDRLPDRRVVVRLDFTGFRPHERYWLLLEHGEAEICKTYAGLDEDLYITADAEAFVNGTRDSSPGRRQPATPGSGSTARHGSYGPSRPGTAAACSLTSNPRPAPSRRIDALPTTSTIQPTVVFVRGRLAARPCCYLGGVTRLWL